MSNFYKATHILSKEKLVLHAKPVQSMYPVHDQETAVNEADQEEENELELLEAKKKECLSELNALQAEISNLQVEIENEQRRVRAEIDSWWQAKEEELQAYTQEQLKQAEEQGYQIGYQKAYQQLQREYEQKLAEAQDLLELAYAEKNKIIQEAEPFLLSLSVKIAQKIIGEEIRQDPQQIMHLVRQGLHQVTEAGEVIIQVSATEYAQLVDQKEELLQYIHPETELKIMLDKNRLSGCLIHTANGSYDVSIDSQLSQIKTSLLQYFEERAQQ